MPTGTAKLCWDSIERDLLQRHTVNKINWLWRQLIAPRSNLQSVHLRSQPKFVYRAVGSGKLHFSHVPKVGHAIVAEGPKNSTSAGTQDYHWLGAGENCRPNGRFLAQRARVFSHNVIAWTAGNSRSCHGVSDFRSHDKPSLSLWLQNSKPGLCSPSANSPKHVGLDLAQVC